MSLKNVMIVVKAYSEKAKHCIHRGVPNND